MPQHPWQASQDEYTAPAELICQARETCTFLCWKPGPACPRRDSLPDLSSPIEVERWLLA